MPVRSKLLSEGPPRTYAVVFDIDDEVMTGLLDFAGDHDIDGASFTAIGGFRTATLAYFDIEAKEYQDIPCGEQVEVLNLTGDIARKPDSGDPGNKGRNRQVHMHAVLGRRDGTTRGGHLKEAVVRPTLEVMLTESPAHLRRRYDENVGLALIEL